MKKLLISLFAFLLVLAGTTYMYYKHWYREHQAVVAMPHIPTSAALIYEVPDIAQQWRALQRTTIAQDLKQLPFMTAIEDAFKLWKTWTESDKPFREIPLIVSVHSLRAERVDCLFYLNTRHTATQNLLSKCLAKCHKTKACHREEHKCHGYKIVTFSKPGTQQHFYSLKQDNYLAVSTSLPLIEELAHSLANHLPVQSLQLERSHGKQGAIHINFSQLPQLLRVYLQSDAIPVASATWAQQGLLTLQLADHHVAMSGYVTDQSAIAPKLISTLLGQTAGPMTMSPYIPQSTTLLQHCTFHDIDKLRTTLQRYRQSDLSSTPSEENHGIMTKLDAMLTGEVAHCTLAHNPSSACSPQLLLIQVQDAQELAKALENMQIASLAPTQPSPSWTNVYTLSAQRMQAWLPCQLFPGFTARYLVSVDDYIVLANSQEAWETWATQYRQKKTWTHDAAQSAWLANTLDQAHISCFVNVPKIWPQFLQALKPTWQQRIAPHTQALQQLVQGSVQLLGEQEEGYYVNLVLKHKRATTASESAKLVAPTADKKHLHTLGTFQTEAPIATGPFWVKSHRSQGQYLLLQDTQHQLYLIDPAGKLLWKKTLDGPITTPIFEIDFYKNKKMQYLFATEKQLHLVDYYGRKVARYPQPLPDTQNPIQLNVVDYNGSKNYRFLLATCHGDIYLYDKHYRSLVGWKPKSLKQPFMAPPFHLRVQGNDYFIALQKSGDIHVLSRKGVPYPGFPTHLGAAALTPLWVQKGTKATKTLFTTLTEGGHRLVLSLSGALQERLLIPQATEAPLTLCPEQLRGQQYVMLRPGRRNMAVLDQAGKQLFEKPHGAHKLQYYALGTGKTLFVVIDTAQSLCYLYDSTGQPLCAQPLPGHQVAVSYDTRIKKLLVCSCFEQQCCRYVLAY